jgi:DNA (cytosine-5)-methyltransferase 1
MLNGLDLFSGIGGLTLALEPWVLPRAYCEIDRYAQAVLLSRQFNQELPTAPIWDDVRTLSSRLIPWPIDIITGGFPCQDISTCGPKKGLEGKRSGLFWQIIRLTGDLLPSFVFLENVPAITSYGGPEVVGAFTSLGYECRWCTLSNASIGGGHIRERWFILAHLDSTGLPKFEGILERENFRKRSNRLPKPLPPEKLDPTQAVLDRTIPRFPHRTHRIRCLGNSVVPLQARTAFKILGGIN